MAPEVEVVLPCVEEPLHVLVSGDALPCATTVSLVDAGLVSLLLNLHDQLIHA